MYFQMYGKLRDIHRFVCLVHQFNYIMRLRTIFLSAFVPLLAITAISCQENDVEELGGCQFPASADAYKLVWSDEFEGTMLDESKWSFDTANGCQLGPNLCGWGNNELQYYTTRDENIKLDNGHLIITAQRESPSYLGEHAYTSARLKTKNKGDWKYGRIDVRARMPIGQGLWAAIWMLSTDNAYGPWPVSGEIDILEYLGHQPRRMFSTIHYGHDFWRYTSKALELDPEQPTFRDDFHVFTAIWNEQCIQCQVDGVNVGEPFTRSTVLPTTYPFDQPFHLILNVAVGGNLPGDPDATTPFPQSMEVDYVRVYQ